jgi:hypothetical protein
VWQVNEMAGRDVERMGVLFGSQNRADDARWLSLVVEFGPVAALGAGPRVASI